MAIDVGESDELPSEFRIFTAGWNDSENGRVLFDEAAARATMAAFQKHGVSRMIDLEHLSLDQESQSFDPDARGWADLELREDGSLWAVNVKWTEDGAARLREKRQRFISPTFFFDDDKRVTKILNIALTALPATHGTPELIAARAQTHGARADNMLTSEQASAAVEAVKAGDGDAALALLDSLIAGMLAGEEGEPPATEEPPPAEGEEEMADDEEPEALADETANEVAAATSRLMRLTEQPSLGQAVEQIAVWRESHMMLAEQRKKLDDERKALQLKERKALAVKLTQLGAETPNTTGLNKGKLCDRLMNEPLKSLRARVAELTDSKKSNSTRGGSDGDGAADTGTQESFSASGSGSSDDDDFVPQNDNPHKLTKRQLAYCAQYKCDPEVYARLNARGKDN